MRCFSAMTSDKFFDNTDFSDGHSAYSLAIRRDGGKPASAIHDPEDGAEEFAGLETLETPSIIMALVSRNNYFGVALLDSEDQTLSLLVKDIFDPEPFDYVDYG